MENENTLYSGKNPVFIVNSAQQVIFHNEALSLPTGSEALNSLSLNKLFDKETVNELLEIMNNPEKETTLNGRLYNNTCRELTIRPLSIEEKTNFLIQLSSSPILEKQDLDFEESILELLPVGVVHASLTGDIIYSNPMANQFFFLNKKNSTSNLFTQPLVKKTKLIEDISNCLENEKNVSGKIETIINKNIYAFQYTIKLNNLNEPFVQIFLHNYSEEYRLENEIDKLKEQLNSAERSKNYIISNISHELRTPLNGIFGMISLLKNTLVNQNQQEFIDMLKVSAENLLHRINDILDYSSLINSKMKLNLTYFNPLTVIEKISRYFEEQCVQKEVEFHIDYELNENFLVKGDPIRFQQILINLIENSIKFTDKGSISLKVSAEMKNNNNVLVSFSLKDTGIGISRDKVDEIFNSFIQEDITHTRKYGGIGLGLSIVKQLLDLMNGIIFIDSKENKGTTINFYIPFLIKKDTLPTIEPSPPIKHPLKILIAEDDPINLFYTQEFLRKNNYIIETVSDGSLVTNKIKQFIPNIIILDIGLPKKDGIEVTRAIRGELSPPLNKLPIIALTSHTEKETEDLARLEGVNVFMQKPLNEYSLLEEIRKFNP